VEPPRIHDLQRLARLHPTLQEALVDHAVALGTLTMYEAETRYPPGVWVTPEEAQEAVKMAESIREVVRGLLGLEP
jgi:HEPN domain-containing protein